jgi:hypothetical protein
VGVVLVLTKASSRALTVSEKETFAPAQQDRVHDHHHLIEQSLPEERRRQRRTSRDDQVGAVVGDDYIADYSRVVAAGIQFWQLSPRPQLSGDECEGLPFLNAVKVRLP